MLAVRCLLCLVLFLFALLSPSIVVSAQPSWLREGVYAVYRFSCAYALKNRTANYIELQPIGGGYYRWEVVRVDGVLAVLNVTLKVGNIMRSILVTINTETMDLIEDGRVWGKAWLWIDLVKLPAPSPDTTVVKNITMVMNWLNETVENPRVSGVHKTSLKPVETGLGPIDTSVVMSATTSITCFKTRSWTLISSGFLLNGEYEVKCGLLVDGRYMDDILSQKFGIIFFDDMVLSKGYPCYWMVLEDTNLEIGVGLASPDPLTILIDNSLYIFLGVLAVVFVLAFVRGRVWLKR